jgi:gamma-glutamylcyclotransferase (GGCT)/AIG2-like uncharacterized protein YtfP|tara:strand:+ start:4498 stop:4896 length:399 start_codon:yes stop_codon:yes gene_type:complete
MRLAAYGTLRRGGPDLGVIEGFSLVFPGTQSFPAMVKNENGKGVVVELLDVDKDDLNAMDRYENVEGGLYVRTTADVELLDGNKEKAWVYVAGPVLWEKSKTFTEVPDGDWFSEKTAKLLGRVYEQKFKEII